MNLTESEAWQLVIEARHGVLGTVHPDRGVDLVPVVFIVDDDHTVFVPIDTVKAKTTTRLQRLDNLLADSRCTLLVDHYDDDWSRLWWVRVIGNGMEAAAAQVDRFLPALAARYEQYAAVGSVSGGILVTPQTITGWSAYPPPSRPVV
jgi:PPOX class probable F420-dependent enzyme